MGQAESSVRQVTDQASETARQVAANPWIEWLARLGFVAKGVVYITIGVLATQAAIGSGGATTDTQGALEALGQPSFGLVPLIVLAIGLLGHAVWRFVEAAVDPECNGTDAKGWGKRIGFIVVGVAYVGLALSAVQLIRGADDTDGPSTASLTAWVLGEPFGRVLVGAIGLGVIGGGLFMLYQAYSAKFKEKLMLDKMSSTEQTWTIRSGRFGHAARGIVFGIIGGFLVQAALQYDAQKAQGLGGALQALERQRFGPWLLGIVAVGLIAYGVYTVISARYQRIFNG